MRPQDAAARALGLAALVCRETMEEAAKDPRAADMHALVLRWTDRSGALKALEAKEIQILASPLGKLARADRALAFWRLEQLGVLGWALGKVPPPQAWERLAPRWVARRVGFLRRDADAIVKAATLRPTAELAMYAAYVDEAERKLEVMAHEDGDDGIKAALAASVERRNAINWLLGERALELEAPLLS